MRPLFGTLILLCGTVCSAEYPRNPFGIHTLIQDQMTDERIERTVHWTHHLVGDYGYIKLMVYPLTLEVTGAHESWKKFVRLSSERNLLCVFRMDESLGNKSPDSPNGTYGDIARVYADVARDLLAANPTELPMFFEIRNEPNNSNEWGNDPNPHEYGRFFVAVARALHALGDPRVRVMNGALSPGGSYDNLLYTVELTKVEGFTEALDVWASHSYPGNIPPEVNLHNGRAENRYGAIDGYVAELVCLASAEMDVSRLPVMITEFAYDVGHGGGEHPPLDEGLRTEYIVRAWRDHWGQWPELLAVTPYYLQGVWDRITLANVWIAPFSGVDERGLPTEAVPQYWAISDLAKAGEETGSLSGVVRDLQGDPVSGATVRIPSLDRSLETNSAGFFILGDLAPGIYEVVVEEPRYESGLSSALVMAGRDAYLYFRLSPGFDPGRVVGTLRDALTGDPLAGVFVELLPGAKRAKTDEDGQAVIRGIEPGSYDLMVRTGGYDAIRIRDIAIAGGETQRYELTLNPNRLGNGGLEALGDTVEQTASGWAPGDWKSFSSLPPNRRYSLDPTIKHGGTASQRVEAEAGAVDTIWQFSGYSDVVIGSEMSLRGWIKTLGLDAEEGKGAFLRLTFFTNDMERLTTHITDPLRGDTDWREVTLTAEVPERAGRYEVVLETSGRDGSAWFDDVLLQGPRPER